MKLARSPIAFAAALGSCTALPLAAEGEGEVDSPPPISEAAPPKTAAPEPAQAVADDSRPGEGERPAILRARLEQGGWLIGQLPRDATGARFAGQEIEAAEDGMFFLGIDRDAPVEQQLVVRHTGGGETVVPVSIAQRDWRLQHINAPYRGSAGSDEEFRRLRAGEIEQIVAARAKRTEAQGWRQDFIWPLEGRITGVFGSQRVYQGKPGPYHGGLDIAAPVGTPYVAPADGVVILATESPFTLEGYLLMIDHGGGLNSAFLHNSEILVREGDRVEQGQAIAKVGSTGRSTGPHLHWGLKWRDARIDPLALLD